MMTSIVSMLSSDITVGSYVVATKNIGDIQERSVGLVKSISKEVITVSFIGKGITVKTDKSSVAYLDIKKTGKPYDMKICNICHILKKDKVDFDINQTDAKGRKTSRPSCRVCRVAIDGKSILPAEDRKLEAVKPKDIFTCPICGKRTIVGVTANIIKDHDHVTGKAREWICDSCNTGLGRFRDDKALLRKAIAYLEKYEKNQTESSGL